MTRIHWYEPVGWGNAINREGRVISLPRRINSPRGTRWIGASVRKTSISNSGYLQIAFNDNRKTVNKYVHRLVAETFIPNPDNLGEVNHKDGDKLNPSADNLEWCSREENVKHSKVFLGFSNAGEGNGQSKITAVEVESIWKMRLEGMGHKDISNKFNVSKGHVGKILRGEKWKELSQKLGYLTLKQMA